MDLPGLFVVAKVVIASTLSDVGHFGQQNWTNGPLFHQSFLCDRSYGIAVLYLGLVASSARVGGLPAHYQLAGELKNMGEEERRVEHTHTHTHTHSTHVCNCNIEDIQIPIIKL